MKLFISWTLWLGILKKIINKHKILPVETFLSPGAQKFVIFNQSLGPQNYDQFYRYKQNLSGRTCFLISKTVHGLFIRRVFIWFITYTFFGIMLHDLTRSGSLLYWSYLLCLYIYWQMYSPSMRIHRGSS